MNRKIDARFFLDIIKNAKYIPYIIWNIKNWPTFFLYYLGIKKGGGAFCFRNGVVIRDIEGSASGTIAVVFIRKHYGSIIGKSVVVDIGSNIGVFAIYAAMSNSNIKIYAFEPIKANYDLLEKNISENNLRGRIIAFNLGISSKTEKREFYLSSSAEHSLYNGDSYNSRISVDCLCLNDVLNYNSISKVDLLKINAEGAEYEILYSAPKECFDKIDEIRMEYHKQELDRHNLESLRTFLEGFGYKKLHLCEYNNDDGFLWMKRTG